MFGLQSKRLTDVTQGFTFTRRAMVLGGVQAGMGLLLAGRMAYIAIADGDRYKTLADSNRINLTLIPPRRGWIVDRNGQPIANNRTDFRVDIIPSRLIDRDATLAKLTELLGLNEQDLVRIREDLKVFRGFQPVQVAANLDWQRYAAVSVRLPELPGVAPARGFTRNYPDGAAVAHLMGYVGAASAEQYEQTRDPLYLTPGFKVGKDNLEKTLQSRLAGKPGAKRVEVTARGKLVRELTTRPDTPGETIRLTIDAGLQRYAARRLGDNSGSVVVIDLLTGGLLTMASMPAYDPNSFSDGIGHDEWDMLSGDDHLPLVNKAMQGLYPPGSTFKPASALALLGAGVDPEERVYCNGGYQLGNRRFGCLGRHGPMNLHTAIARSCNTYFYHMGRRIGIEAIADSARKLGLGAEYELPLPSQRYGTVPDPAWKQRRYDQAWAQSDTLNTAIGQGYLLVNPVQLAVMAARVASGRALTPSLLVGQAKPAQPLPFPAEHLAAVRSGMDEVVNGHGTAGRSRLPLEGIRLGGKTGTAQVRRISGGARGGLGVPWKYRDHGLFVCFAPVDNPRYAASVVIEHGMSGSGAAAPVASDTLLYLFDREKALAKLETLETAWGGGIEERMARQAAAFTAAKAGTQVGPRPPAEAASAVANATTPTPAPILDQSNNTVAPIVVPGE
jgi:penicillin-binding protein 2